MDTEATHGEHALMGFKPLKQTNEKLYKNENLSGHNKEVLTDFFRKARSGGAGDAILRDYASRFNKLAEVVDFPLDNPDQEDLENLVNQFNSDQIRKNNGEKYSDYSKDKFWSTLSKFYRWFIKKQGKGYREDVDGEELLEDLEIKRDLSIEVDPDRKPTPEEIKKVAEQADNLRNKAIILFGWATGARIGEIFDTDYNDDVLRWNDIEFQDEKMWVTLDGKTGEREIPIRISQPIMERYWESCSASHDDPVFRKQNRTNICPECGSELSLKGGKMAYEDREYRCDEDSGCGWEGPLQETDSRKKPLSAQSVRKIIRDLVKEAGLEGEFDTNPHDFWRKSRAIYKVRVPQYSEHSLRGFFGWSETSDAPKHYIATVKEDLEKAFAEEFGEEVEYENGYDEDSLRPVICSRCEEINSALRDICSECGKSLTDEGMKLKKEEEEEKTGIDKAIVKAAKAQDVDPEKFEEMLKEDSFFEVMSKLSS